MKPAKNLKIVLVTAPEMETARKLAEAALKARLVACANILPGLDSHYWWRGKIERSSEVLILFKTTAAKLTELEKLVLARHPYDTPEIVALALNSASERYQKWWLESLD